MHPSSSELPPFQPDDMDSNGFHQSTPVVDQLSVGQESGAQEEEPSKTYYAVSSPDVCLLHFICLDTAPKAYIPFLRLLPL